MDRIIDWPTYSLVERYIYKCIYRYTCRCEARRKHFLWICFGIVSFRILKPKRQTRWLTKDSGFFILLLYYFTWGKNKNHPIIFTRCVFFFQRAFLGTKKTPTKRNETFAVRLCPPSQTLTANAVDRRVVPWRPCDLPHVSGARWLGFCSWQRWAPTFGTAMIC